MTSFWQFVTYWWPSFLVILSCAWILLSASKRSTKRESPEAAAQIAIPEMRPRGKQTVWIASLTLIIGMELGYVATRIADAYFPSKLEKVLITATNTDGSHKVVDKFNRKFDVKWCSGPDDLVPGNLLPVVYYRQENGCKRIRGLSLGYSVDTLKDGTRIIYPIPEEIANAR
jgi:hypothetical protein